MSVTDSKGATTIMNIGVVVVENEKPTIDSKNDIYILEGDTFGVDT